MGNTYKQVELIGTSGEGYEEAIQSAVTKASKSLHGLSWFEVVEQRGRIAEGKVAEYQVIIKAAFKLD